MLTGAVSALWIQPVKAQMPVGNAPQENKSSASQGGMPVGNAGPKVVQPPPANNAGPKVTQPPPAGEERPLVKQPPAAGSITRHFQFAAVKGEMSLTFKRDGTYIFSGSVLDKFKDMDFDITLALRDTKGQIILFHEVANATNGVEWNRTGRSTVLEDNFASFQADHADTFSYCFHPVNAGREARYKSLMSQAAAIKQQHEEKIAMLRKQNNLKGASLEQENEKRDDSISAQVEADVLNNVEGAVYTTGKIIDTAGTAAKGIIMTTVSSVKTVINIVAKAPGVKQGIDLFKSIVSIF